MAFITKDKFIECYQNKILPELMSFEPKRLELIKKRKKLLIYSYIAFLPWIVFLLLYNLSISYSFKYYHQATLYLDSWLASPYVILIFISIILGIVFLVKSACVYARSSFIPKIKQIFFNKILSLLGNYSWSIKVDKNLVATQDDYISGNYENIPITISEVVYSRKKNNIYTINISILSTIIITGKNFFKSEEIEALTNKIKDIFKAHSVSYKKGDNDIYISIKTYHPCFEICSFDKSLDNIFFVNDLYDKINLINELALFFNTTENHSNNSQSV